MSRETFHAFVPFPEAPVPHAADGPLAGLTLAVKDLYDVKGYPTGAGSPHVLAMSGTKRRTAPFVARFLKAGARFVGKTVTDELAFSLLGKNAHFGAPINPAAPERITGGSSSGSAAACAGGLADIALGSDTGGSVRAPASFCGLFGIRPTHRRGSLDLTWPLAHSLDTPGFFTRDGDTFVKAAEVAFGKDRKPLPETPRFLLATDMMRLAVPEAEAVLADLVRRLSLKLGDIADVTLAADIDACYWAFRWIQGREAWAAQGALIEGEGLMLGPGVKERFAFGKGVTDADVANGERTRRKLRGAVLRLLGKDGVVIMPTVPDIAPLAAENDAALDDFRNRSLKLLCVSGLTGFPQVSIPLARKDGAPLGLSLLGPPGSDVSLCRLAARIEKLGRIEIA
jgi:amidase